MKKNLFTLLFCLIILPPVLAGGGAREPYAISLPLFDNPPKIDGALELSLWEKAAVLDTFVQYEPREGASPSEKTVAFVAYDSDYLYIAVRCFDSDPKAIRACLTQRDKVEGDDEVTIYLDTFNDKNRAFAFKLNPCGIQTDGIYTEVRRRGRGGGGFDQIDRNWDTFFLGDATIDAEGYTIEMAIPFKSLRFPNSDIQTWGFQIVRNIRRKNEEITWSPRSRDVNGFLIQAGSITINGSLKKGRNLELMPVLTGSKEMGVKAESQAGFNVKYGLTSDLTADLTLQPDFSQVEADIPQIAVNQRYALYFPEKRPFFLEGQDIFDTPINLIYTRKINNPQWGVKLTGKIGRTSMGFLSTYDATPTRIDIPGAYEDEEDEDEENEEAVDYGSGFINILRLKQDLFSESHIGLIFADKEMGESWGSIKKNFNRVGGIDGRFKFSKYYQVAFQIVGSQSRAESVRTGFVPAMNFSFSRRARHLQISAEYNHIPEDFEANLGFLRRKDIKSFNTRISYAFLPQNQYVVDIRPSIQYRRIHDFHNTLTDEEVQLGWFISGWRGTTIWGGFTTELERYEGIDFRKKSLRIRIGSEPFSWLEGSLSFNTGDAIYYDDNPYLGFKTSIDLEATFKPLTNLKIHYKYSNDTFWKARGEELEYKINLISQRLLYQISKALSIRFITDYNDYDKQLYNSFLFSYQLRPGTVFYMGVDDNRERDGAGPFRVSGRYYFIKFSYWWRV
jgi:hypothetical protein